MNYHIIKKYDLLTMRESHIKQSSILNIEINILKSISYGSKTFVLGLSPKNIAKESFLYNSKPTDI